MHVRGQFLLMAYQLHGFLSQGFVESMGLDPKQVVEQQQIDPGLAEIVDELGLELYAPEGPPSNLDPGDDELADDHAGNQ